MPADDNFIKPQLPPKPQLPTKPQLPPKPLIDAFARPLTKIVEAKKNKIEIITKKELSINKTNLSEHSLLNFSQILTKLKKKNKMMKNSRKK